MQLRSDHLSILLKVFWSNKKLLLFRQLLRVWLWDAIVKVPQYPSAIHFWKCPSVSTCLDDQISRFFISENLSHFLISSRCWPNSTILHKFHTFDWLSQFLRIECHISDHIFNKFYISEISQLKTRSLGPFILSIYLPSAMFVTMSWVRYIISSNVQFLADRLFLSSEIFHALGGLLRAPRHRSSKNCSSCDSLSCPCQHV